MLQFLFFLPVPSMIIQVFEDSEYPCRKGRSKLKNRDLTRKDFQSKIKLVEGKIVLNF